MIILRWYWICDQFLNGSYIRNLVFKYCILNENTEFSKKILPNNALIFVLLGLLDDAQHRTSLYF